MSLQSGCDETLKRMNRRYTTKEFENSVKLLRREFPEVALTTDIIVGFPGETEEEFNKTYEFLENIQFYKMHIFKYSKRKGTKAALMPNQVDGNIKEIRSRKLIELSDKNEQEFNKKYMGKKVEILFEEAHCENGIRYVKGHTKNYMVAKTQTQEELENQMRVMEVEGIDGLELIVK